MGQEVFGKLHIDDGLRRIEVNDNGDYILISANPSFIKKVSSLYQWSEKEYQEMQDKIDNQKIIDGTDEAIRLTMEFYDRFTEQLDATFGERACEKVFGKDNTPDIVLIGEFFDQIIPFIERCVEEKQETLNHRYSRSRKGSTRKKR